MSHALDGAALVAALALPPAAAIGRRVPRNTFTDRPALKPAERRLLTQAIAQVHWHATLKPPAVPLAPGVQEGHPISEVLVFEVALNAHLGPARASGAKAVPTRREAPRVAELLHRLMPHALVLVLTEGAGACLSLATKRPSLTQPDLSVVADHDIGPWFDNPTQAAAPFTASLALPGLPQTDLATVYAAWQGRLLALQATEEGAPWRLAPDRLLPEARAALHHLRALNRALQSTLRALKAEPMFARKVALSTRCQQLQAALDTARAGW